MDKSVPHGEVEMLSTSKDKWKKCSRCNGSGIVAGPGGYTTEMCSECEGGWIEIKDSQSIRDQELNRLLQKIQDPDLKDTIIRTMKRKGLVS